MKRRMLIFALAVLGAGCVNFRGGKTEKADRMEKASREEIENVGKYYRPEGKKPELPVLEQNSNIDSFLKYALLNNPRVESAFYRWQKAVEETAAAKYLPYPEITFEASISSIIQSLMAGFMLMFPARDKVLLEVESHSVEAHKERLNFEAEILKTAFAVKDISYRRRFLREKIRLTEKTIRRMREIETLAITRFETAQSPLQDVLSMQIERAQAENMLADMTDYDGVLLRQFAAALGIPAGERPPLPPDNLQFTGKVFDEEHIWSSLKERNQRLALAREEIKESEILIRQAYSEYSPDFKAGLAQSFFSSMAMTTPMFTISVPRRGRVSALVAAAESGLKMNEAGYTDEELDLAATLSEALFRWRQADREAVIYRDTLLPRAEADISALQSAYAAGTVELDELLRAEKTIYDFSINYLSAITLREITLNEISLLIAGILPEGIPQER